MTTAAATKSATDNYVLMASVKIALIGIVIVHVAAFIYGLAFGIFSWNQLASLLNSGGLPAALNALDLEPAQALMLILNLTSTPVIFAAVTAAFPFLGCWIYLGVPKAKATSVGLLSTLLYGGANLLLTLVFNGASLVGGIQGIFGFIGFLVGLLIGLLYVFLVMGIGFNLAKAFKLKAQND